ncbi:tRNA-specific adenosine deaminase [invertebrate metagenome]|uniref:tRNA-specific adenosine deaminase 2 n=1 Tax=invertebrate metagenome TaxID=1711999 RepID=A0A2H9T8B3_9ZZZZ
MVFFNQSSILFSLNGKKVTTAMNDIRFMNEALKEAQKGLTMGEVPVGAIVTRNGEIIARACNQPISSNNPVAHAEILALQQAAQIIQNYRLVGCELYVTLEPCTMCAGAIIHSRIDRLIFGTAEPKAGAIISASKVLEQPQMNHRVKVTSGIMALECSQQISHFFKQRRQAKRQKKQPLFSK